MKCVILQPSYIPWRGFFHQIFKADLFVFYDDVMYDSRGWRNRNRIKGPEGAFWLTIPVHSKGLRAARTPVDEVSIHWEQDWREKHFRSIVNYYRHAPFLHRYEPMLREIYSRRDERLADFTIATTIRLARELGISHTRFERASRLGVEGQKTERLLRILKAVGATHYISGPSARDYLREDLLADEGITLEYMKYDYRAYNQLFPPFDPQVSILDLLLMMGPEAPRYIWGTAGCGSTMGSSKTARADASTAMGVTSGNAPRPDCS